MVQWQHLRWGNLRIVISVGEGRNCAAKLAQHLIIQTKIKSGVKQAAQN